MLSGEIALKNNHLYYYNYSPEPSGNLINCSTSFHKTQLLLDSERTMLYVCCDNLYTEYTYVDILTSNCLPGDIIIKQLSEISLV